MTIGKCASLAASMRVMLGAALMAGALQAQAQIVQGQLQLQWGDPRRDAGQAKRPGKLLVALVTDDGKRQALDPVQARIAAGDLYALAHRRVAVDFGADSRGAARGKVEAIVPVDDLGQAYDAAVPLKAGSVAKAVVGTT
ncbi:MAG TPA: hypothetical protein VFH12_02615, partial [Pseudoxanthomonas sp.]|nr:hypothetical protein [Pseudoxanthomonas sp.]